MPTVGQLIEKLRQLDAQKQQAEIQSLKQELLLCFMMNLIELIYLTSLDARLTGLLLMFAPAVNKFDAFDGAVLVFDVVVCIFIPIIAILAVTNYRRLLDAASEPTTNIGLVSDAASE